MILDDGIRRQLVGGSPHARPALDALVRGRLVVAGDSPDGTTYEIAHERTHGLITGITAPP